MNEKLFQYLWNFKIFKNFDFIDTDGNAIEILDFGKLNHNSGPDFLFGKIKTKDLVLAGNIELHIKSSDYIFHNHVGNPEYENLILHVVFHHDIEIDSLKSKNIPTLELKNYINENLSSKYESLQKENTFIPCENIFDSKKIPIQFAEETLLKKLDSKSIEIEESLKKFKNNYEAVLFQYLAYSFGLKINAEIFKQIAENLNFSIINKIRQNQTQLEALLFGICNWLENPQDSEMKTWKQEFDFVKNKFQVTEHRFSPKFSKLRPPNFPTIRLSQLASLYHENQNLFSKLITAKNIDEVYQIFRNVKASNYWNNHFSFGKTSSFINEKKLTKDFVDLVLINAILPIKYTYNKNQTENINDEILEFYSQISAEKNTIINHWKSLKVDLNKALETQAYLFHYKNNCQNKKCLDCAIGLQLLKK